jgi:cysteine-rich repeat protein
MRTLVARITRGPAPQEDVVMGQRWLRLGLAAALCTALAGVSFGCGGGDSPPPPAGDGGPEAGILDGSSDGSSDGPSGPACGDGTKQRDEICDDGNTVGGDGCSADCMSDETCGNGINDTAAGEVCDDGNTAAGDGCAADCSTDYACGNGVLDTIAGGGTVDEVCDDGNTVNGDGCDASCTSDETCGNSITDLGAGEVCDDGNTVDGDLCSADCLTSFLCGNGVVDSAEECDDSNRVDGDGCNASCQLERCGNGRVDSGEVCDDGNTDDADGCKADCAFTCTLDADCADTDLCNGIETCTSGGSTASRCAAGTPPADGFACGSGLLCNGGACVATACGDGFLSAGEACDDGNTTNGDGCDSDCTFTCSADADCSDGVVCNGTELCSNAGTVTSACGAGTPPSNGTTCGGTNICNAGSCVAAACGDSIVSGTEQCDDGANANNNDGCRADCTFTCTAANAATNCSDGNQCTTDTCTGTGLASVCSNPVRTGACTLAGSPSATCNASGACVASVLCGNGTREGSELCDDGNANNNDGCRSDCTWTCTTATAAANCNDTNACTTDACTGGGTLASRCTNTTVTNGTVCGGTNICVTGSCVARRCGDSIVSSGEQCDDGANANNNDGCRSDCTWTCTAANAATNCDDANACTSNTCTGTNAASRCSNPTVANGTTCGGTNICVTGSCVASRCGDLLVTAPEVCDDGNTAAGDGCENTCQWTCTGAASCADTNVCNGAETCTAPSTIGSRCAAGAPAANGTACDDGSAATPRDICLASACGGSRCGDGYLDAGATPAETCDDGNTTSGDGCSSTCTTESATPPTAFRDAQLELVSPRIVLNVPLGGCQDITNSCARAGFLGCQADSINTQLATGVTLDTSSPLDGLLDLSVVNIFRPLGPASATSPFDIVIGAACTAPMATTSCSLGTGTSVSTIANNMVGGSTCFAPVAADVNTRAGAPAAYAPTANTVSGPCFVTNETVITIALAGINIPLERARVSATYSGSPPNQLVSGVIVGFLPERAAADILLPATLPSLIANKPLYNFLQAGGRPVNNTAGVSVTSACNIGGGTAEDDADNVTGPAARGFWFFLNFRANVVPWTSP